MYVENIANNARNIRINSKITIAEVFRMTGIRRSTISNFERRKENITVEKLCEIVSVYNIHINYDEISKIIGDNIKKFRKEKKYTKQKLAALTNCEARAITNYENATVRIMLEFINRIAKALEVDPKEIYAFDELDTNIYDINAYYNKYTGDILEDKLVSKLDRVKKYNVIDGDTLGVELSTRGKLRLIGIDTPEIGRKFERWGLLAKDYTKYLLNISNNILVEYDSNLTKTDEFGRHLCWVWILINDEYQLLNYILVQSGFADNKYLDSKSKYYSLMLQAEKEAKQYKRVIWGYKYLDPYWDYNSNKHKNKIYVIEVDNKYLKIYDYDLTNFELSNEYTKIRYIEEARYIRRLILPMYKSSTVNILAKYK